MLIPRQTGTAGTDHGWASCMFLEGGSVQQATGGKAAKVRTEWPGPASEQVY